MFMQFSQGKYLQSILNKWNCPLNIIHTRSHSQLFLYKCVVTFRGIMYVSNAENFELTEIDNKFKCLWRLDNLKVRTTRGRGSKNQ